MSWVTGHSPNPASLDSCVTCGLCLPVCPTFRITGDETASPRGRLTAMSAVAFHGASVDDRFADIMSLCLQCRACETACPSMVPFGEVMEASRAESEAQVPAPRPRLRRFTLVTALRSRLLLRFATFGASLLSHIGLLKRLPAVGGQTKGLRRLPWRVRSAAGGSWGPQDGPVAMLLTGCVADVWFSDIHTATIEVLVAGGYRVVAPSGQTCCGALASHSGFADDAAAMAKKNIAAFKSADVVVADVAGCGAHLKSYGRFGDDASDMASKVRDINEVIADGIRAGRLPTFPATDVEVGIQDPCHLEHGQRAHTAVDAVIEAAGFKAVPIDRGGMCCGAAGVYQLEHKKMSADLGQAKAERITKTGIKTIVSANAGCEMQLRRYLDSGYSVQHPVELYADRLRLSESR